MLEKHGLVRTIYLYLFALVGLALVVSGTVRFLDMGLKMFIFTKAEDIDKIQQRYNYPSYPVPLSIEKMQSFQGSTSTELTSEEKTTLKNWLADYEKWREDESKIDYLVANRQREASNNLAMILVGLPLYLYHWGVIRKETREKEE